MASDIFFSQLPPCPFLKFKIYPFLSYISASTHLASSNLRVGSFSCASSAAAELTETDPVEMEVSDLTLFPAVMACLNRPFR